MFLTALPAGLSVEYAQRVEAAGFRSCWFPEITQRYREIGLASVHLLPSPPGGFYPLYEDHFPVESLSQLPQFDFPALLNSFNDAVELLAA